MKELIDKLFDIMCESSGYWITNNRNIYGDQNDTLLGNDDSAFYMLCENEDLKICYEDIIDLVFQEISDMIIAVLKIKNMKPILFNILNRNLNAGFIDQPLQIAIEV